MTRITDESLLEKLNDGDTHSLGVLYERYKDVLFSYFFRNTGDYDVSNDLLMETFERIYKYKHSYKAFGKVRSWMFQIASNLMKDYYRRSGKLQWAEASSISLVSEDIEHAMDTSSRNRQLQAAMGQLRPAQRNIINMYYLLEMRYEDIAASEHISINNARIRVCRALKKLKEILKGSDL